MVHLLPSFFLFKSKTRGLRLARGHELANVNAMYEKTKP